jgi:methylmalonyl-CoA/ethylmalonyl-CoA epimerase
VAAHVPPDLTARLAGLVERVDHFSIAAWSADDVVPVMTLMGGTYIDSGEDIDGFAWSQYRLPGGGKAEIIAPAAGTDSDHFLVRYLERRGPGLHHITLKVHNLDSAIEAAEAAGFNVVDRSTKGPWREAFVHPGSASGILIQLAEWEDRPGFQDDMIRPTQPEPPAV